ncbi:MAG: UDP-N-acetylmuramyl-tripeptide synthetase [Patescibacteria group bacterium]|jgi:UDP-N-acetylmuramoyl-L-alanyl-D-glutamate--2,6-diaminopimelate ligase|nr:UDP-N-acetylmuramyl-tripeptide synthetase [Patescibacteria group bacterium]
MLHALKQYVPEPFLAIYHLALARAAVLAYRSPSDEMIVIGVTGTNGKSSTVSFIAQLLTELGEKVGYTSTAGFNIAGEEIVNKMKMTMPGRFALQALLRRMVKAGCTYAVVETSSQGILQNRHLGINYDAAVFTNLTPEHIEAHGGFENYKKAKGRLFAHLSARRRKTIGGRQIPKMIIVNADDEHAGYYASFTADKHVYYTWQEKMPTLISGRGEVVRAQELESDALGANVIVNEIPARFNLPAKFQRLNALAAIATVVSFGFSITDVLAAAETLQGVAGRYEKIEIGQSFSVIIDYAYEPYALKALFAAVRQSGAKRVIGVHGSAGGGRDIARRPLIGKLAAEEEAITFVTNEDPYDEDPLLIMEQVATGARKAGKIEGQDLFVIGDRQAAIDQAIALAKPGDTVIITGKGSEPVMAVAGGKKIPWSDKTAVLKALEKIGYNSP